MNKQLKAVYLKVMKLARAKKPIAKPEFFPIQNVPEFEACNKKLKKQEAYTEKIYF